MGSQQPHRSKPQQEFTCNRFERGGLTAGADERDAAKLLFLKFEAQSHNLDIGPISLVKDDSTDRLGEKAQKFITYRVESNKSNNPTHQLQ